MEQNLITRIGLSYPQTLRGYSNGIFKQGFREIGVEITALEAHTPALLQIHGAPDAQTEDAAIIATLQTRLSNPAPTILLIHRPDEIQSRFPELRRILASAAVPFGLCLLGDLHIDDEFFDAIFAVRKTMPHGFFSSASPNASAPFIVGAHTHWDEMRSLRDTLRVLTPLLRNTPPHLCCGYLGGLPATAISPENVNAALEEIGYAKGSLSLVRWDQSRQAQSLTLPTLFLGGAEPPLLHFTLQLYHWNRKIRTGENSGSLHRAVTIPVIAEMNGAERTEDLSVMKLVRGHSDAMDDCDFPRLAEAIRETILSGQIKKLLRHNEERATLLSAQYVARLYFDLFLQLAD